MLEHVRCRHSGQSRQTGAADVKGRAKVVSQLYSPVGLVDNGMMGNRHRYRSAAGQMRSDAAMEAEVLMAAASITQSSMVFLA